jgi:hypothetical protein
MFGQTTFGQTTPHKKEEKSKHGGTGIVLQSRWGVTSIAQNWVSETLIVFAARPESGRENDQSGQECDLCFSRISSSDRMFQIRFVMSQG